MFYFAIIALGFLTAMGLLGVFIAVKYPRAGVTSLSQKLSQKIFQRSFLTIAIARPALC